VARRWRPATGRHGSSGPSRPGDEYAGSEFARVARHLAAMGHSRRPDETSREWLARLGPAAGAPGETAALLDLHYRYRFDPRGLSPQERRDFAAAAERWIRAARPAARWHAS
jgi:protein-glutamine gamma-glutamyltransferase